jgi:hypothetical protein
MPAHPACAVTASAAAAGRAAQIFKWLHEKQASCQSLSETTSCVKHSMKPAGSRCRATSTVDSFATPLALCLETCPANCMPHCRQHICRPLHGRTCNINQ